MLRARFQILAVLIFFSLSSCLNKEARPIPTSQIYRPPTQIPTALPATQVYLETGAEGPAEASHPTPTPSCINGLWFLEDITIPDGTLVNPGELLDKRWRVQNNGTCNWDQGFRVNLIAGPGMGVPVQQTLVPALSGTEVVIRMVYIAPDEPGNYRSAWQAFDPLDNPFGDPFFIDIVVAAPEN